MIELIMALVGIWAFCMLAVALYGCVSIGLLKIVIFFAERSDKKQHAIWLKNRPVVISKTITVQDALRKMA